jgi:hypothetical protein
VAILGVVMAAVVMVEEDNERLKNGKKKIA